MEQIKTTDTHLIYRKRSGRYAVKDSSSKAWVNGDDKTAVLLAEGLIKHAEPKAEAAEPRAEDDSAGSGATEDEDAAETNPSP